MENVVKKKKKKKSPVQFPEVDAVKFVRNLKARVYHVPVPVRKLGGVQSIEVPGAVHFGE